VTDEPREFTYECPECGAPLSVVAEGWVEIVPGVMGPETLQVQAHLHRSEEEEEETP
jgi:hypothetical protein